MSKKWIFQEIKDAQEHVLYDGDAVGNIQKYYERLRETVAPETYVKYELWTCDIYVDMEYIINVTKAIYGDRVTKNQVIGWIYKNVESRHYITDADREIKKMSYLTSLKFRVEYDSHQHVTNWQGAFDLLNGRMALAGVTRDAKAAALCSFERKCLSDSWQFPFEAGVITITKEEDGE